MYKKYKALYVLNPHTIFEHYPIKFYFQFIVQFIIFRKRFQLSF